MAKFTIAHLYPDLMNLYGAGGNLTCLRQRLIWRGHECAVQPIGLNEPIDYDRLDMLFMGGGSDREKALAVEALRSGSDLLFHYIESDFPFLFIDGAYQLLGRYYESCDGKKIPGLDLFDFSTSNQPQRMVGNILINARLGSEQYQVIGFENHGGRTYLDRSVQPWGQVIKGYGNNGEDQTEGMIYKKLIGTYLHGPLLPKNPAVADFFIAAMGQRQGLEIISALDDTFELNAQKQEIAKLLR